MRALATVLTFLICFNVFASNTIVSNGDPIIKKDRLTFSKLVKEIQELQRQQPNLTTDDSCLDEVLTRRAKLLRLNIFMPLTGSGITMGSVAVTTVTFLAMAGNNAWAQLFGIVFGVVVGLEIGAVTYVGLQATHIAKAIRLNRSARIITQARLGEGKRLERFIAKVLKNKNVLSAESAREDVIASIVEADQSGKFCDASLKSNYKKKKYDRTHKLKHGIASYRNLLKYVKGQVLAN